MAIRYFSHIEKDMRMFLDIIRASNFPMDCCFFHEEENAYVLRSHPFMCRNDAIEYASYLEQIFRRGKATISKENENRYFLYYNPDEIYEEDLEQFVIKFQIDLFKANENYFNSKSRQEASYILSELAATNVPMDCYSWNRQNSAYYLYSNSFSKQLKNEAQNYCQLFRTAFGPRAACSYQDHIGRSFVVLNPNEIEKNAFSLFTESHRQMLFNNNEDNERHSGSNVISCFYKSTEADVTYILKMLRKTRFSLDGYLYDEVRDRFYMKSAVFNYKENADHYAEVFQKAFGITASAVHPDSEGRYFVFVDPTQLQINAFKHFVNKHLTKLFPDKSL